jgi:hypothetical protein
MAGVFISINQGQQLTNPSVAEGTSAPTADVYIAIGTGNVAPAGLSRFQVKLMIDVLKNYLNSDAPPFGSNILGLAP